MTTTLDRPSPSAGAAIPGRDRPDGVARVHFLRVPDPTTDGDLAVYSPAELEAALEAASHGSGVTRVAGGLDDGPDDAALRAVERAFRRRLTGEARRAWGSALFWLLAGPALTLLLAWAAPVLALLFFWLPPAFALVATLGGASGGWLLATIVGLLPTIWGWGRAWQAVRRARRAKRLASLMGNRRYRESPLVREGMAADTAFSAVAESAAPKLRSVVTSLGESGSDAAAEGAGLARQLTLAATRAGLLPAAALFHSLYSHLGTTEHALASLEQQGSGVFAERKVAKAAGRARGRARALVAPFRPTAQSATHALAPLRGFSLGMLSLVGALALTGMFFVPEDGAVLIDSFENRLTNALSSMGVPIETDNNQPEIFRQPGIHWAPPAPFTARHTVSVEPQLLTLRARLRQTGPTMYDVVEVQIQFRIADLERWAALDANGEGASRLQMELSRVLETVLQRSRQEARQAVVQQNPALANDQMQQMERADQLVQSRLEDIVRTYVTAVSGADAARQAGIQISSEHRYRVLQRVPAEDAGAMVGE